MKLCICDIDGVIVNATKRFLAATIDGKIVWEKALSSELLHLDELVLDAVKHLELIRSHYDQLVLLTSRYDHMRDATVAWLREHGVPGYDRAIFKSWDNDRYRKTKIWKAEQVITLLREASQPGLFNAPQEAVTDLLIVEDEEANREEIHQEVGRWIMSNQKMRAHYFTDLYDVARAIEHTTLY